MSLNDPSELHTDFLLLPDEERAAGDGRTLLVRLLKWDEVATTPQGREAFARQAFADVDPSEVLIESQAHGGALVGRGQELEDDGEGPLLRAYISETSQGNDLLTLIRDGVLKAASVTFRPDKSRRRKDGVIERMKADLRKVAILPSGTGAYPSAQVEAVRGAVMTEEEVQVPEAPPTVDLTPVLERVDAMEESLAKVAAGAAYSVQPSDTLDRFDSFSDAFEAATTDPKVVQELNRALADNVLHPDNAALDRPQWLGMIIDRITFGRPAIRSFGTMDPGPSGMTVHWLEYDQTGTFTVGEVTPEKSEIPSGTTKYLDRTATLKVYAGGSDDSLVLLERGTPSFRALKMRDWSMEYAEKTEQVFTAELVAKATASAALDLTATKAADKLLISLFDASVDVESACGEPANIVLVATDVYKALGGLATALPPGAYGTQNVAGTAQASSLVVNASGLRIVHDRYLANGTMIVGHPSAAAMFETGPKMIEALDVAHLGIDQAIYGFCVPAVFRPAAVRKIAVTV